jgi:hypothetical protein
MLLSTKYRKAFLGKRGQTFSAILGHEALDLPFDLLIQCALECDTIRSKKTVLHEASSYRRCGSKSRRKRACFVSKTVSGHDAIIYSQSKRFTRGNHFACVEKLGGACRADEPRQEVGSSEIGIQTEVREALAKTCLIGRDTKIASQRKISSASCCGSIDRSHDRLRNRGKQKRNFFSGANEAFKLVTGVSSPRIPKHAEIAASAERAPSSGQHDCADRIIVSGMTQGVYERFAEFDV